MKDLSKQSLKKGKFQGIFTARNKDLAHTYIQRKLDTHMLTYILTYMKLTIASEGRIILENTAFVDEPLLVCCYTWSLNKKRFEWSDSGSAEVCLDREFATIGTSDIDSATAIAFFGGHVGGERGRGADSLSLLWLSFQLPSLFCLSACASVWRAIYDRGRDCWNRANLLTLFFFFFFFSFLSSFSFCLKIIRRRLKKKW